MFYLELAGLGILGVFLRYFAGLWLPTFWSMPLSTLLVNVLGSLAAGAIYTNQNPSNIQTLVMVGLLGALTTFSSFSFQTIGLIQSGQWLPAGLNILTNNVLSLVACYLGTKL